MSGDLHYVAELLRRETGIAIRREQLPSLSLALARAEPGLDASGFLAARVDPARRSELLSRLIDEVTVRETFFLRQREELEAVEWPALLASAHSAGRDRISVWVAACASGEEAYSLALLACAAFGTSEPPVSILATDISAAALESAHRGSYGPRSLRAVPERDRERYFAAEGDRLSVGPELRDLVTFARHNLVADEIPPAGFGQFELIACRNVLIYFEGEVIERVLRSLESALAPSGMLLLGAADRLCGSARRLAKLEPRVPARVPQPARSRPRGMQKTRKRDAAPPPDAAAAPRRLRALPREPAPEPLAASPAPPGARGGSDDVSPDLRDVLRAADSGELERAVALAEQMLRESPLDCDAHFIRGLAELGLGDAHAAVKSFRRVLYIDPTFGLAAFKLGRAHEACGDRNAAYRSYERALRSPRAGDGRHALVLEHVDLGDVAAACAIRLRALGAGERGGLATTGKAG
jgi:chemotaxis protein methyltransferase CheR